VRAPPGRPSTERSFAVEKLTARQKRLTSEREADMKESATLQVLLGWITDMQMKMAHENAHKLSEA